MSIGTGVSAGIGCPQQMRLRTHPCFCMPPESRAGSTVDFRVVETGPTFLRLAWRPGPERPQGYSLIYAVQGEGMVSARVGAAWAPCLCAAPWAEGGMDESKCRDTCPECCGCVPAHLHRHVCAGCGARVCAEAWTKPVCSYTRRLHAQGSGCVLGRAQWLGAWYVPPWLLHMVGRQQTPVPARDQAGATHLAAPPWSQAFQRVPLALAHVPASSRCSPPLALIGLLRAGCRPTDTPSMPGLVYAMSLCPPPHPSRRSSKGEEPDSQCTVGHTQQPAA